MSDQKVSCIVYHSRLICWPVYVLRQLLQPNWQACNAADGVDYDHDDVCWFCPDRPNVLGIPRWLPASPAEAQALPREGASALVMLPVRMLLSSVSVDMVWELHLIGQSRLLLFDMSASVGSAKANAPDTT